MTPTPKSLPVAKTSEAARPEGEADFCALAELSASAVFVYRATRCEDANPAAEALTGYSRGELLGMSFYDLFPPAVRKALRLRDRQLRGGEILPSRPEEYDLVIRGGQRRRVELAAAAIIRGGKPAILAVATDVTEARRAEARQEAVRRIARAAAGSVRPEDLFPAMQAALAEVMAARNFCVVLLDRASGATSVAFQAGDYPLPGTPVRSGRGLVEYVLRTGEALLCDPDMRVHLEIAGEIKAVESPPLAWLGAPILVGGRAAGVLTVQDGGDPAAYGPAECSLLEFAASQLALVLDRRRAETALLENEARIRRRADELTALYETTRDLATQHDIAALLQAIVERAASLLGSPAGAIFLYDEEHDELEAVVAHGPQDPVGVRVKPGEGLSGAAAQTIDPLVVDNYRDSVFFSDKFDPLLVTSAIAAPMHYSGELVGVLTLYELEGDPGDPVRRYGTPEIELITFFAGAAASAVHNARLFGETRQRLVELELLYQASLSASQIHSLRAVAQRIVDTLENLLDWKGSIWLVEDQRPALLAHSSMGLTGEGFRNMLERVVSRIHSFDTGIVGWVCTNGRTIRTGHAGRNPYFLPMEGDKTQSQLCVPLRVGGGLIGCINVNSDLPEAFSEHDERLLTTLANQAAVAIENARLFDETRRRASRQAALNTIITASAQAGTGLDEVLNIALEQTLKALGMDMGAIWLSWSPRSVQRVASRGISPSIHTMMMNVAVTGGVSLSETLVVDDWTDLEHAFTDLFLSVGVHSAIVVPLLAKDKRVGGLAIASPASRRWAEEEVALVEAIGREVGLAAERAKLFEQTTDRLRELEAVNRISTSLRQAHSLDEMLPHLLDETLGALNAEAGGIWLYDRESDKLRQVVGRGWCLQTGNLEWGRDEGVPGHVWKTGDIYFSNDVALDPLSLPSTRELAPPGWSAVCVPVRSEHETIGVFMVSASQPRQFSAEDARLLVTLTEMAGSAIHRMKLNEQTLLHAAELEARVDERTAELQEALLKAQTADRLKSDFIANVNHELRTPLTNLILYYQMLKAQPTVRSAERLDVIGRELQRLRSLIEDLLNLSRLDLGQVSFRPIERDLNTLIRSLVEDRRALAEERGLQLRIDLQPDLPLVFFDQAAMEQAVSNLLTNALNYTPSGGEVLIGTDQARLDEETWIRFTVQDTGPGISEEDLPHLFERFYRGRAGHRSGAPGTGLGLAIVRQVIERHHGQIEVGNGSKRPGAIFTVWLPLKPPGKID